MRNGTRQPWSLFNLELREFFDRESPFGDGLSFGQATDAGRPFRSDRFVETLETTEPFDGVQFTNGLVAPGETVTLSVVITDTTPRWEFYCRSATARSPTPRRWPPAGPARSACGGSCARPAASCNAAGQKSRKDWSHSDA